MTEDRQDPASVQRQWRMKWIIYPLRLSFPHRLVRRQLRHIVRINNDTDVERTLLKLFKLSSAYQIKY
jgi:hypothetical protein